MSGHTKNACQRPAEAMKRAEASGCHPAANIAEAVKDAELVITMLPAGQHVRTVYEGEVLPYAPKGSLLVDCSTIPWKGASSASRIAIIRSS